MTYDLNYCVTCEKSPCVCEQREGNNSVSTPGYTQVISETEAAFARGIREEVESSNIRMSSNDDVEYAVGIIDKLIDKVNLLEKKHPESCHCIFCS